MKQALARRSFLRVIGMAPIAAKMAAEDAVSKAAVINVSGIGSYGGMVGRSSSGPESITPSQYKMAFASKAFRGIFESEIFEQQRHVPLLDYDIAQHKTFSLAAKIAFQRQRNVERYMQSMQIDSPWERLPKMVIKFLGGRVGA